jgi:hypothetical protein
MPDVLIIAATLSERIARFSRDYMRKTIEAPDAAGILHHALQSCGLETRRLARMITEPADRFRLFLALADLTADHLRREHEFSVSDPWLGWRAEALDRAEDLGDLEAMRRWIDRFGSTRAAAALAAVGCDWQQEPSK